MRTKQQINNLYSTWRHRAVDDVDLLDELHRIADNEDEIAERFYTDLVFGTGGLRGVIGAGTNRVNIYTIGRATLGLARMLAEHAAAPAVAIAYDSRIKSERFARHAASILAAQGITVHIFDKLMPTPALSFAVRALSCDAGIVVTASHNPAKYNGYKVYGQDGCQITPEQADRILQQMEQCPYFPDENTPSFPTLLENGSIRLIKPSIVSAYVEAVKAQSVLYDGAGRGDIDIVYTPLNGSGRDCVLRVLNECGFDRVSVVPEQEYPDGNFPTCPVPNPEMREALSLGLDLMKRRRGDLLIATDPDCDRVGIAVRDGDTCTLLSGNEVGILLFDYICKNRTAQNTMPDRPVLIKTIVTTEMVVPIATRYGVEVRDVLTGFKYIGEQIGLLDRAGEADRYIFGFEESYGYLSGGYVRDKDGVNGTMLIAEMAAHYHAAGQSLVDVLGDLYRQYGTYLNRLQNIPFEGREGVAAMQAHIARLRDNPPDAIGGIRVQALSDYLHATKKTSDGQIVPLDLPESDVLRFDLENGSTIVVRPSGTEPKLKIYYSAKADNKSAAAALIDQYTAYFTALMS